jgi:hypothetical protein
MHRLRPATLLSLGFGTIERVKPQYKHYTCEKRHSGILTGDVRYLCNRYSLAENASM